MAWQRTGNVLCAGSWRNFLQRYRFVVVGYVVMPDHVHLLLGASPSGARLRRCRF